EAGQAILLVAGPCRRRQRRDGGDESEVDEPKRSRDRPQERPEPEALEPEGRQEDRREDDAHGQVETRGGPGERGVPEQRGGRRRRGAGHRAETLPNGV